MANNKPQETDKDYGTVLPKIVGHVEDGKRHNRGGLIRDSRGIALNQEEKDATNNN